MFFVHRALGDPFLQECQFLFGHRFFVIRGRHHFIWIVADDPFDQLTFVRLAWHDGARINGNLAQVEPQVGLSRRFVNAVTGRTFFRQDRLDISGKADLAGR